MDGAALASEDGCEGLDPAAREDEDLWAPEELLLVLRLVLASVRSLAAAAAAPSLDGREREVELEEVEEEEEVLEVPPVFFGWEDLAGFSSAVTGPDAWSWS